MFPGLFHRVPWVFHGVSWAFHSVSWVLHSVSWAFHGAPQCSTLLGLTSTALRPTTIFNNFPKPPQHFAPPQPEGRSSWTARCTNQRQNSIVSVVCMRQSQCLLTSECNTSHKFWNHMPVLQNLLQPFITFHNLATSCDIAPLLRSVTRRQVPVEKLVEKLVQVPVKEIIEKPVETVVTKVEYVEKVVQQVRVCALVPPRSGSWRPKHGTSRIRAK